MQILQKKVALAPEQVWEVWDVGFNVPDKMNTFFLLVQTCFFFPFHFLITGAKISYHHHKGASGKLLLTLLCGINRRCETQ